MLWLLKNKNKNSPIYDCYYSFVVRAPNPTKARQLAAEKAGDECQETWLNDGLSTCEHLKNSGAAAVIIGSFNAG